MIIKFRKKYYTDNFFDFSKKLTLLLFVARADYSVSTLIIWLYRSKSLVAYAISLSYHAPIVTKLSPMTDICVRSTKADSKQPMKSELTSFLLNTVISLDFQNNGHFKISSLTGVLTLLRWLKQWIK